MCQRIETLAIDSGCESQYDALYSCIQAHDDKWVCNPDFCDSEMRTVHGCVDPHCQDHPEQCDSPFGD